MHEQALLDHMSNYHKQLMSIDRRIGLAASDLGKTKAYLISNRPKTKRSPGRQMGRRLSITTPGSGVAKVRLIPKRHRTKRSPGHRNDKPRGKIPMQEFPEIASALCDVHAILTHLVGIEMTQHGNLRGQAEGLEDTAFQTVSHLADVALLFDKRAATLEEFSEFEDLLKCVSTILVRDGLDSELQERRRRRLEKLKPGCDELTQTLENLSIAQKAVEDDTAMHLK